MSIDTAQAISVQTRPIFFRTCLAVLQNLPGCKTPNACCLSLDSRRFIVAGLAEAGNRLSHALYLLHAKDG
jgi:hypothetical protein